MPTVQPQKKKPPTPAEVEQAAIRVQFAYPQIYYACHTRHTRRRSGPAHVSQRDGQILVHLDTKTSTTVSDLSVHLGLARSTVSEAVTKLERNGYVDKGRASTADRRHVGLVLTSKGVAAVTAVSVLERTRLHTALGQLSSRDLKAAISGLMLLASACRKPSAREER